MPDTRAADDSSRVSHEGRVFWTDARIKRVGLALLFALAAAIVIGIARDSDRRSAILAGDFPGFYSPAVIVQQGRLDQLYDIAEHYRVQREAWPSFTNEMYISVYPPYTSILLSPLALLSPDAARTVWTLLSLAAYIGALFVLRRRSAALHTHFGFVAVSGLLFMPVFFGVLAGQNTAFSLLLYVGGVRLLQSGRRWPEWFGGVLFGLWLFKPQFGLLAGLYLLCRGRWIALSSFVLVTALLWALAAAVVGPQWLEPWLSAALQFGDINYQINDYQMTSFAGLFSTFAKNGVLPGAWALPLASVFSALLIGSVIMKRVRSEWILAPMLVLISPQTLFYDLSLALASCLRFSSFHRDRDVNAYIFTALCLGVLFALRSYVMLALPCFAALLALAFVLRHAAAIDKR